MEIFVLLMLYYLSQNPDFLSRVKPLMGEIKNSQELLKFITDLSKFSAIFSQSEKGQAAAGANKENATPPPPREEQKKPDEDKKTPASQTSGIADDFIQKLLENYFQKR